MGPPITKSRTISWEFPGAGDLRNSPDCCGSERELRGCDASERYASRLAIARDLGKVCVHTPRVVTVALCQNEPG